MGVFAQGNLHPQRYSLSADTFDLPLLIAIEVECAILATVHMVRYEVDQRNPKLELGRELVPNLVYAIQKLEEHRRAI